MTRYDQICDELAIILRESQEFLDIVRADPKNSTAFRSLKRSLKLAAKIQEDIDREASRLIEMEREKRAPE